MRLPTGQIPILYDGMLDAPHLLIAGATGSGKSVVENGILYSALYRTPAEANFVLIDPKRVELAKYRRLPHTIAYASEPAAMIAALEGAVTLMDTRYKRMQHARVDKYNGPDVYVVIDELADLMTTARKAVQPLIQRLAQLGRAARVHVIACTQSPLAAVIPTPIKCNFDCRVGLRTASAQDSRNILGQACCEQLPKYGELYYRTADGLRHFYNVPMIPRSEIERVIKFWTRRRLLFWI